MTDRSPAPGVIFLGGLGRSGTTLLERLLGESPGVTALGEVAHLWARGVLAGEPCGCGAGFAECDFWRRVGERAFGGWSPVLAERVLGLRDRVDRTRRIPRMGHRDLDEYVRAYRRVYTAAASVAGSRLVIDSSKHASLAWCLAAGGVDVHVVHVVRDPRAVAHSWRRSVERPEDGRPMTRWGPIRTSLHWTAQNLALDLLSRRGVPLTRVRYEDLVADPRATLTGLASRLGLDPVFPHLDGSLATLGPAHTASGNPMRFTVGPVRLIRDDSWKTGWPRHLVAALTKPLMRRYGYRPGGAGSGEHAGDPNGGVPMRGGEEAA
ncbi:sulfotransferase [Nonomuraea sp. NPDC055795]